MKIRRELPGPRLFNVIGGVGDPGPKGDRGNIISEKGEGPAPVTKERVKLSRYHSKKTVKVGGSGRDPDITGSDHYTSLTLLRERSPKSHIRRKSLPEMGWLPTTG